MLSSAENFIDDNCLCHTNITIILQIKNFTLFDRLLKNHLIFYYAISYVMLDDSFPSCQLNIADGSCRFFNFFDNDPFLSLTAPLPFGCSMTIVDSIFLTIVPSSDTEGSFLIRYMLLMIMVRVSTCSEESLTEMWG